MSIPCTYNEDELIASNPPEGYEAIEPSEGFGVRNGPIFHKETDGDWVRGFRILPKHVNKGNICHGGMVMTFADIVAARAVYAIEPLPFVTLRLNSDFISPGLAGEWVEGRATAISKAKSVVFFEGEITSREKVLMTFSGLFKLIGKRK